MYGVEDSKIEEIENNFAEEDRKLWLGNNDDKIIYHHENLESNNILDNLNIGKDSENYDTEIEEFTNTENEEILEAIDNLRKFKIKNDKYDWLNEKEFIVYEKFLQN